MAEAARAKQTSPLRIGEQWQGLRGHAHGVRGPVMCGALHWSTAVPWKTDALAALLHDEGGLKPAVVQQCLANESDTDTFFALALALEDMAQSPVAQKGVLLSRTEVQPQLVDCQVAMPSFYPPFTQALISWLGSAINMCSGTSSAQQRKSLIDSMNAQLHAARTQLLSSIRTGGVNTARIARAAAELGLPVQVLTRSYLYVGSGANARIFNSTMTEETTALGVALARSKSATAALLAMRGLPVPRHQRAGCAQDAVKAAHALGYPVVVKPDDRDGGAGVNAGLTSDEQVIACYAQAAAISPNVLVEKHVEGLDYRITVDNGRVVKVIGRQPGGVLGDGRLSVRELVAANAAKPSMRGNASAVSLDEEALALLAGYGMTADSVPAADAFVVLRRRANMSTGGTSRDAMADMHPDNARLAIRAAQALRLDLAGIDFIIPDIAVSWMECTAAICEVNAQPQISTEFAPAVYHDLLTRLVREPTRLHAVLLVDVSANADCDGDVIAAAQQLAARGERVLSVRSDGTWLGDERIAPAGRSAFARAVACELEVEATAVVAAFKPGQLLRTGLPWLHVDEVRVLRGSAPVDEAQLQACLDLVAPHLAAPRV
ncbi:hypothetical protein [Caenimonas koreensis]|uniref:ATP-binding protein n=1 Tax=Caenimonas koreensis TaxID=367474 RepID=UPI003782E738